MTARRLAFAFALIAGLGAARADDASTQAAPTPDKAAQEASMQSYGATNAACMEWTDECFVCARDPAGPLHCSTAGIACVPKDIVCRKPKMTP